MLNNIRLLIFECIEYQFFIKKYYTAKTKIYYKTKKSMIYLKIIKILKAITHNQN